jgi:16S rRNA G966 N2-methylase RsmD
MTKSGEYIRPFSTKDWERQQLTAMIAAEIKRFAEIYAGQVNLSSEAAQRHLAECILTAMERDGAP